MASRDPDEVAFEAAVKRLIPGYLAKRAKDLADLRDACRRADLSVVKDIGHRLAGSGSSYGFVTLTVIGRALEAAAEASDLAAIAPLISEFTAALADASSAIPRPEDFPGAT